MYKFERLRVWHLSLELIDLAYEAAGRLPRLERYNLADQLRRAAVSVALNIGEGSTGQSDPEQVRFLGLALRSLVEVIACLRIADRRKYLTGFASRGELEEKCQTLMRMIQSMRRALGGKKLDHKFSDEATLVYVV